MKKIALIFAALAVAFMPSAQETYSLRELLETGLEKNYSVRIVVNDQQISDNNMTLANAGYLPTVGLSGGYTGRVENTRTVPVDGNITNDNGVFNQSANAGVSASWYVFDGLRIQTNYKRLQELQAMGEINTRITMENFISELTAEYYNFIQQKIRLDNFEYAVALSKERLRIDRERKRVGSGSGLDTLQARVYFNADSSRYINQQAVVLESLIRINELLANSDVNAPVDVMDSVIYINESLQWNELREQTLRTNASLLVSGRNSAIAELDLKNLKSRNYPYLSMNTGYGYTWNHYGGGSTLQRGNLGFNFGATVGMTIFDGNRRREQNNARIRIDNAQLEQKELEQTLVADLATFWQAYLNNLQVINMERENLNTARKNYDIAMYRYQLGDMAGIEMREAQQSLLDAEERKLSAYYNTKLCEISLLQISGNVFDYLK